MVRNVRRHFNVGDALLVIYDVVAVVSDLSLWDGGYQRPLSCRCKGYGDYRFRLRNL